MRRQSAIWVCLAMSALCATAAVAKKDGNVLFSVDWARIRISSTSALRPTGGGARPWAPFSVDSVTPGRH